MSLYFTFVSWFFDNDLEGPADEVFRSETKVGVYRSLEKWKSDIKQCMVKKSWSNKDDIPDVKLYVSKARLGIPLEMTCDRVAWEDLPQIVNSITFDNSVETQKSSLLPKEVCISFSANDKEWANEDWECIKLCVDYEWREHDWSVGMDCEAEESPFHDNLFQVDKMYHYSEL
jgi:hypothetical protein